MFPTELTSRSFQVSDGEFGWSREDARLTVSLLVQQQHAILGGELWWVPDGARDWTVLIPQRRGSDAVYAWETKRAATPLVGEKYIRRPSKATLFMLISDGITVVASIVDHELDCTSEPAVSKRKTSPR